ncbi:MAG: RNA polymerase sigma factor [Turicibacter sp.]|nr:RNA polymerase sigma factor [Turicibacter sp.]
MINLKYLNHVRRKKHAKPHPPDFLNVHLKAPAFEHGFEKKEQLQAVLNAIEELPFNQKQAILLSSLHGLSHKEISKILNVSEGNVKFLIFQARVALKKYR